MSRSTRSSTSWETVTSSSDLSATSFPSSSSASSSSSGYGDINEYDERSNGNTATDVSMIESMIESYTSKRRTPSRLLTNSSQAKNRIACKLMEGYTLMGNGEVCLRCRMPLMVDGKNRDDNSDYDNCGRKRKKKKTTGICVVCDEECASAAEFERKLVMFSAMHAKLMVDDDDDNADEDQDDGSKDRTNDHVQHNMRRAYSVEKSVRSCDYSDDENSVSYENEDSYEEAIVDEDGAIDAIELWNSETDGDDNNAPLIEDYDVLPYQGEDTSMNIEVALRRRCKFCAMDIDESTRCTYCYVSPKLDSVDEIGSPSVSDFSMLDNFLQEENLDLFIIGSTLERNEQEDAVEHSPKEGSRDDIRKEGKLQVKTNENTSNETVMMNTCNNNDGAATHSENSSSREDINQQRSPVDEEEREVIEVTPNNDCRTNLPLLGKMREAAKAAKKLLRGLENSQSQYEKEARMTHPVKVAHATHPIKAVLVSNTLHDTNGRSHMIAEEHNAAETNEEVPEDSDDNREGILEGKKKQDDQERDVVGVNSIPPVLKKTREAVKAAKQAVARPMDSLKNPTSQCVEKSSMAHPIKVVLVNNSRNALPPPKKKNFGKSRLITRDDNALENEGARSGNEGEGGGGGDAIEKENFIEVLQPLVKTMLAGSCGSALTFGHDFPSEVGLGNRQVAHNDEGRDLSATNSAMNEKLQSNQSKHKPMTMPLLGKVALLNCENIANAAADSSPRLNKNEVVKNLIAKFWQENFEKEQLRRVVPTSHSTNASRSRPRHPFNKDVGLAAMEHRDNILSDEMASDLTAGTNAIRNGFYRDRIDPPERDQAVNYSVVTSGIDPPEEAETICSSATTLRYNLTAVDNTPTISRYDVRGEERNPPTSREDENNDDVSPGGYRRIATSLTKFDQGNLNALTIPGNYFATREKGSNSGVDSFSNKWRTMRDDSMSSIVLHANTEYDVFTRRDDMPSIMDGVDIRERLEQLEFESSRWETNKGCQLTPAESVSRPSSSSSSRELATICEDTTYGAIPTALHPIGSQEKQLLHYDFLPTFDQPEEVTKSIEVISRDYVAKRESCNILSVDDIFSNTMSPSLIRYGAFEELSFSHVESPSYGSISRGVGHEKNLDTSGLNHTSRHSRSDDVYQLLLSGGGGNADTSEGNSHKAMSEALDNKDYHGKDYSHLNEHPELKPITRESEMSYVPRLPSSSGVFSAIYENIAHKNMSEANFQNVKQDKAHSPLSPTAAARRQRYKEYLIAKKSSPTVQPPSFDVSIE